MIQRADVVMVEFPYTDMARSKVRPAVVVQNDRDNLKLRKTIVAMITGNLRRRRPQSPLHRSGRGTFRGPSLSFAGLVL
jgi:mRNA interferase MazF